MECASILLHHGMVICKWLVNDIFNIWRVLDYIYEGRKERRKGYVV